MAFKDESRLRMDAGSPKTLICLPYAGGSSITYSKWEPLLGSEWKVCPVELPGRGKLANRSCLTNVPDMIDEIIQQLEEILLTTDYSLFGHSFGALLGYELCLRLVEIGYPEPQRFFVSAANPPHKLVLRQRHKQTETEFLNHLKGLGGLPDALFEQPEALKFFVNVLRSDFTALENFGWKAKGKVTCPIHVIFSDDDSMVETASLQDWQACTESAPEFFSIGKKGHMYLDGCKAEIVEYIQKTMHRSHA